jgi:hypothetical protein
MEITKGKIAKPTKAVIYGPEGVGKSSLAALFPAPVFVDVEGGTNQLDVARTPRPTSWPHFLQIIADLARDQQGFQTLVIDTVDWLEKLAVKQICAEYGINALGENSQGQKDYGKSYSYVDRTWSDLLTMLEADFIDTGKMHVLFVGHSTTRVHELPEEAGQYDRYQIATIRKPSAEALKGWANLLLFCNYQTVLSFDERTKKTTAQGGVRRMMYAEHRAAFDAKNRDGLPAEMPLGIEPLRPCFVGIRPQQAPAAPPAPVQPAPAPVQPAAPTPAPQGLSEAHRSLAQMITEAGVTYDQVLRVIIERKKNYPQGTPFEALDPQFISGWVFKFWPQILEFIAQNNATATQESPTA